MSHESRFLVRVERNLLIPLSDNGVRSFFLVGVAKRDEYSAINALKSFSHDLWCAASFSFVTISLRLYADLDSI